VQLNQGLLAAHAPPVIPFCYLQEVTCMQPDNRSSGATIDFEITLKASPQQVYGALATAEGWDSFLTEGTSLDARPGGLFIMRWQGPVGGSQMDAVVVEATPYRRFSFSWERYGLEELTTVTFEIEPIPEGTRLTLHEEPYPETPDGLEGLVKNVEVWGNMLTLLKEAIDGG
jgi:uncharacterized protein YndB with AHSA1/START domain